MNRRLITAAATALAVVALSACGSSTAAKPATGAVDGQAVARKMVDAMIASKTTHVTTALLGKPVGAGDIEFTNPVNVAMKTSRGGRDIEIVQVGGVTYMKDAFALDPTRPWVEVDPKGTDHVSKLLSWVGDLSTSANPKPMVSMMEGIKGKDLGTKQVGGVSTRQYSFEIPISTYVKAFGPDVLKQLQGTKAPVVIEYSVGDDNLLRKYTTAMVVSGTKLTTEATYSDWGKPVSIVAPPAAQIGPLPQP